MDITTIVLPSARAIRQEQLSIDKETLFLPNFITMSEFISKLCLVKNFTSLDDDSRVLLLLEASDFNAFDSLQIQRNFFTFTKNSSYIFKFFEELSAEMYDISKLLSSDIYGEFEEHISILKELYERYEKLCSDRNLLDKIFLPKLYDFNASYVKNHKNIELHLDGHLTNFEFEILLQCCTYSSITIIFNTTKFNSKMQSRFLELGIELEVGYEYTLSLNSKTIISKTPREKNKKISCTSFSESLLQIAFVKQKLYEFMKKGYKPENIAIILPDEKIAQMLKSFDTKSNFNFAMGEAYKNTPIYQKLYASCQVLDQQSKENFARLDRVEDDLYAKLLPIYHKSSDEEDVLEFLKEYKEGFSNKTHVKIFNEELYGFKNILPYMQGMKIKSLLSLFLQRLGTRTLDDVRGGRITVMGVLETRSVHFDAVIIVDFSDSNVPKKSDKDMFLNTQVREMAKLPTMNDRENLQKHYYEMLLSRSKEAAISYVSSSESSASRFLKQLNIQEENNFSEQKYADILFKSSTSPISKDTKIVQEYSFKDKKISATRLKTFLACKRKYYYKYIVHLQGHEIPRDMPKEYEIGNHVHMALSSLYTKKNTYDNQEELQKDIERELDVVRGESELDKYLISMQKIRLEKFCKQEIERFKDEWKVHSCEESFEIPFAGATLIGQIDRIDKRDNEIYVLDYKTGSYTLNNKNNFTEAIDFQLEFYYLLAAGLGNVVGCAFYDLKDSRIVEEAFLNEKLAILESHIKDLLNIESIDFELCEDETHCRYCDYQIICERT